jgi:SLA1 homology domain 1, SHD1
MRPQSVGLSEMVVRLAIALCWISLAATTGTNTLKAAESDNPFATDEERGPAPQPRTWNDRSGKFTIEATLLRIEDKNVVLRRSDEKEITVPLAKLSDADQKYLAEFKAGMNAARTGTKADDSADKGTFVTTDFSAATVLDLSGSRGWKYQPDAASTGDKLRSARVTLQKPAGFFDKPVQLLPLAAEQKMLVVFEVQPEHTRRHDSRIQTCNLQSGTVEANWQFGQDEVPLCISPDGRLILSRAEGSDREKYSEVRLYRREGNSATPISSWKPFQVPSADKQQDMEMKWAEFVDPQHLLTRSGGGRLVLWQVPEIKAVWACSLEWGSIPVLSAGRKYAAMLAKSKPFETAISIVNLAESSEAGHIDLTKDNPGGGALAIRDDGQRLAFWQDGRIRVWDLGSHELVRDFGLKTSSAGGPENLAWITSDLLLLRGMMVVDVERQIPVWTYSHREDVDGIRQGQLWKIEEGLSGGSKILSGAVAPPQSAQETIAKLKTEDFLVIHPGLEVAIDMQIDADSDEVAAIKKTLTDKLEKNGIKIVPESKNRFVVAIEPGKTVTIQYRSFGMPMFARSKEHEVATQVLSLSFQIDGESVWRYQAFSSPPHMLQLKSDEEVSDALARVMKEQENSFVKAKRYADIWIPAYFARVPGTKEETEKPKVRAARERDARLWGPHQAAEYAQRV